MTNSNNNILYTGITNNPMKRAYEHKMKTIPGFTSKYNVTKIVYYECFQDPQNTIAREKQIKGGSRKKKIELINKLNPKWNDLYKDLLE